MVDYPTNLIIFIKIVIRIKSPYNLVQATYSVTF